MGDELDAMVEMVRADVARLHADIDRQTEAEIRRQSLRERVLRVWRRRRNRVEIPVRSPSFAVSPELRAALDNPKTRYRIVDAWRLRTKRESRS